MNNYLLAILICLPMISKAHKHDLVDITKINSSIRLDIRYATANNFTHKAVYTQAKCYLRKATAEKLSHVQQELEKQNLGLKVFDGYRPRSVQYIFWRLVPDERYVAHPQKGSRHNRGTAVDVTLVDKQGKELFMPTEFDDFTQKAHRNYTKLAPEQIKNRTLLEQVMTKHGFVGLSTEWWHFNDLSHPEAELLDISFEELARS
jgi:zinc D-Ala-D-Ala dipeptidase